MSYYDDSKDAVEYVRKTLLNSKPGSLLIMNIGRDKSGVYFAHIVISESLENTEEIVSKPSTTTSLPTIPDG